jgi:hypothetical protein
LIEAYPEGRLEKISLHSSGIKPDEERFEGWSDKSHRLSDSRLRAYYKGTVAGFSLNEQPGIYPPVTDALQ